MREMTNIQVLRLRNRIVNRIYRDLEGGTMLGVDLRTLRIISPGWHNAYIMISQEINKRKIKI